MIAAYADPPYLGCADKHYKEFHENSNYYDSPESHRELIVKLQDTYDCWAMSLHEPSLSIILPMCPVGVRVGAWVKPFAAYKKNVTRAWTWEPVIFSFHRARRRAASQPTWRDHIAEPITMRRGFPGAKPEKFCFWIFEGLNLIPSDSFVDLFPGSGAVSDAWETWKEMQSVPDQLQLIG